MANISVEKQNILHRGLPHAHIVCRIKDGPDHSNAEECIEFINKYISIEIPIIDENSSEEDVMVAEKVEKFLMHECHNGVNGCLGENGICSRKYSKDKIVLETHFDENNSLVIAEGMRKML